VADHVTLTPFQAENDRLPDRALTWLKTTDGQVAVACGRGHLAFLDPLHQIANDGTIAPSLGCPADDCDWHVFGRLEGWA
jgi:hypothetical protein